MIEEYIRAVGKENGVKEGATVIGVVVDATNFQHNGERVVIIKMWLKCLTSI